MAAEPPDVPVVRGLSWSELADALWLAAVIDGAEPGARPDAGSPGAPGDEDEDAGPPPEPPPDLPAADPAATGEPAERFVAGFSREAGTLHTSGPGSRVGATGVLHGAADIVRALRPLKLTRRSLHEDDVVLDEDLTAERAMHDQLWLPATKPGLVRRLDLTVVVDSSPSMALWQPTVGGFLAVLRQLGAFRSVQIRLLETEGRAEDGIRVPVLRGGTPGASERRPGELLDRSGNRVLLVLTDGASESWRQDLVSPLLAQWARVMPVAVVHMLPRRLWGRGGLPLHQARLTTPGPFRPNRRYGVELPDAWVTGEDPEPAGVVPVPVVELDARWLGWWARLVTRAQPDPVPAMVLLARDHPEPAVSWWEETGTQPTAQERVKLFHGVASQPAFRLATLLAAVPVSLPIARFVQAELVPEAGSADLAEVLTSGLLQTPSTFDGDQDGEDVVFEFSAAVREALLAAGRRSETAQVVVAARREFGDRHPVLLRISDALEDPERTPIPDPGLAGEVVLERVVMRALSGPYAARAERLQGLERQLSGTARAGAEPAPRTASESMVANVREEAADSLRRVRELTTDSPAVWGAVPARNPAFIGRQALLQALEDGLGEVGIAVLHGMGGLGKTQIATEYLYRHLRQYDLVWWISAAQETQIRASLTELARQLRLPGAGETVTAVPAAVDALREGRPYRRWLVVFDSAEGPESILPFFPTGGPGEIIVTSRDPGWRAVVEEPVEVGLFDHAESIELLRNRDPGLGDEEVNRLAEKLGDLPLALAQAAVLRAETGMPVEDYLELFDQKVAEILATAAPTEYEVAIAAAWNVSFDELGTRNPAAHQLLQICAFFAPEPISRSLFTGVHRVSVAPELDAAMHDPTLLEQALRDVNRLGLARLDYSNDTLLLHWLVQLVLRNRMSETHREEMRHRAHLLLANRDPGDPASARLWPQYQLVLPHIYAAELIGCDEDWVRELVINLLKFLYHWGDHSGATALAEKVVQAWSVKFGEENALTLEASERLGFFLWVLGRYEEAEKINNRTLLLYQQKDAGGKRSEQTLNAQLSVAVVLKARGDFAGAKELNLATYYEASRALGPGEPKTLTAAHDLVVSLLLTGEYAEAHRIGEETYERCTAVLGYDNTATISTLNILAICRRELGDYTFARIELQKTVERVRRLFSEDNAGVVRREYHLAVAQRKDGYHTLAYALSRSALDRFRFRYGQSHPNTLPCALAHAIDLRHAGDLAAARQLGQQAVDLYRGSLGPGHPHTVVAEVGLGVTLRQLGDSVAAHECGESAFRRLRNLLGPDHPHTVAAGIELANDWFALGEVQRALMRDTDSVDRARRVLGEDHPITLAAQLNRALDLQRLGRIREALSLHQDAVARYRRALRAGHPAATAAEQATRAGCDIDPTPL
ncbi:FxSxx-COOH system tetratricopeptide repeat protein [Amycolatopsis sp. OK19-0408]|uniref:FxSxx-COOH system tetratricopeptide repeat protein n=1 Tax=Amycolatopsis iheyensis TaxID=2945988 RepID=A0A9X2N459_9PSEU|nr:FxSxx-COOH system tetratricopeptide repeat protein [Amycolatopsis iheyensis]MCR6481679.1 FxSxx-COOH system tetratricopeptide repeat protein [Amycolatopsis iheyensis]